jgi:hypothetical protein
MVARADAQTAARRFEEVLRTALEALERAGGYVVDVDSQWQAVGGRHGPPGGGRYRLQRHGGHYRVEVRSQQAAEAELICVCDGRQVLTYFPPGGPLRQYDAGLEPAGIGAGYPAAAGCGGLCP